MDGAVVATEAGGVGSIRGDSACCLYVTSSAFLFEDSVRFREATAAVNARIFENGAFCDPN